MSLARDLVLDVANQLGGAAPGAAVLHDWSRYGSDGAITGAVWAQVPTTGLWVLDFDPAIPSHVEIAEADCRQLNFTSGDFSLVKRVFIDNLITSVRAFFTRGLANADGYYWFTYASGQIGFRTNQAAATQLSTTAVGALVINTWYTLGVSRIGATVHLYRNGVDITDTFGVHINPLTCARSAKIGIYDDLAGQPFDGRMALLKVFNYALTSAQHRAMYHKTRWLFGDAT